MSELENYFEYKLVVAYKNNILRWEFGNKRIFNLTEIIQNCFDIGEYQGSPCKRNDNIITLDCTFQ